VQRGGLWHAAWRAAAVGVRLLSAAACIMLPYHGCVCFQCQAAGVQAAGCLLLVLQHLLLLLLLLLLLPQLPLHREGAWMHVDAAWAGTAALCPEQRHWFAGLEAVDSYSFNPHKWWVCKGRAGAGAGGWVCCKGLEGGNSSGVEGWLGCQGVGMCVRLRMGLRLGRGWGLEVCCGLV
jgi:hypothetical protein